MQFKSKALKNKELRNELSAQYPALNIPWKKKFAWFPVFIDDRIVWLEFYEIRVSIYHLMYDYDWQNLRYETRLSQS